MKRINVLFVFLLIPSASVSSLKADGEFELILYNSPDLFVDLGEGSYIKKLYCSRDLTIGVNSNSCIGMRKNPGEG